jgi:hypothetical protein
MSEHRHLYTSNDFSVNQAHNYTLLIQADVRSFSYAVIFEDQLLMWAENHPLSELTEQRLLGDVLTTNYKQVVTGLASTGFTLLPNSLLDANRVADVARLLDVSNTEKVNVRQLDDDNTIIYKLDEALISAVNYLDDIKLNHTAAGWINAIANNSPANHNLYLDISGETVAFLYFKDGKLRFYNTFAFKNKEELAYFCAFVAGELQLQPADITLVISGAINAADPLFTFLGDFFGQVTLNDVQVLDLPQEIERHKILSLAALSLCV